MRCLLLSKENGQFKASIENVDNEQLPPGEVRLQVEYSTLNYKDGLAITNRSPVVRQWPMVPGIDMAGRVLESSDSRFRTGDKVILNGWGVGENHWGGLAEQARVKADWLLPLPVPLNTEQTMAMGTAGYTAMLCMMALEKQGVSASQGEILVTGATGGVGSIAVLLLAGAGYSVCAATGKKESTSYLQALGAHTIIDRAELAVSGKPLQKERFAGVIDTVGSHTLVNACAQTRYGGAVAACGLAQGFDFPATVMPFILRGISLLGIDSVMAPYPLRAMAWQRLSQQINLEKLKILYRVISLEEAIPSANALMSGTIQGRLVVRL